MIIYGFFGHSLHLLAYVTELWCQYLFTLCDFFTKHMRHFPDPRKSDQYLVGALDLCGF